MDVIESFSSWFRHRVDGTELTQRAFAKKYGFAPSTVGAWYRGERVPDPPSCERLADVFNADSDWVLTLAGHRPNIEDLPPDDPRTDLIALVRRVQWDEERVQTARALLETWIKRGKGQR
jgi:transcriptional regulator with XRE-family HTH domain